MRDPDRIDGVVDALRTAWKRHPDMRLGQLVLGMAGSGSAKDPFYIEDDEWLWILTIPEADQ